MDDDDLSSIVTAADGSASVMGNDSLVSLAALLSAVSSSVSTSLAKKRVAPPDLVSSSVAAKSVMLLVLQSCCCCCLASEDEADDFRQVLCVGRVNPQEELMSSAEAEKSRAAEAAVGLDEAVMAAIYKLCCVEHYGMFTMVCIWSIELVGIRHDALEANALLKGTIRAKFHLSLTHNVSHHQSFKPARKLD